MRIKNKTTVCILLLTKLSLFNQANKIEDDLVLFYNLCPVLNVSLFCWIFCLTKFWLNVWLNQVSYPPPLPHEKKKFKRGPKNLLKILPPFLLFLKITTVLFIISLCSVFKETFLFFSHRFSCVYVCSHSRYDYIIINFQEWNSTKTNEQYHEFLHF